MQSPKGTLNSSCFRPFNTHLINSRSSATKPFHVPAVVHWVYLAGWPASLLPVVAVASLSLGRMSRANSKAALKTPLHALELTMAIVNKDLRPFKNNSLLSIKHLRKSHSLRLPVLLARFPFQNQLPMPHYRSKGSRPSTMRHCLLRMRRCQLSLHPTIVG